MRAAIAAAYVAVAASLLAVAAPTQGLDPLPLQLAGRQGEVVRLLGADEPDADPAEVQALIADSIDALHDDDRRFVPLFVVVLGAGLGGLLWARRQASRPPEVPARRSTVWHSWTIAGGCALGATFVAAALDLVENALLRSGLSDLATRLDEGGIDALAGPASGADFPLASFAAGTKLGLLLLAVVVLVGMGAVWVASGFHRPARHATYEPRDDHQAAWAPEPGRIGVSCSGGGVRSASFCLGALQVLDHHGVLERARYVTAVSGGGYMAASWAIANGERADDDAARRTGPRVYAPLSPEERWVRLHSSHLIGSALVFLAGALRLIAGILFGWLLIWLLMFAVARPIGWLISSDAAHPELRARTPVLETATQPALADVEVTLVENNATADPPFSVYAVTPSYSCAVMRVWPAVDDATTRLAPAWATTTGPGVVRVERGEASIVDQPTVRVAAWDDRPSGDDAPPCSVEDVAADPYAPTSDNADGPAVVVGDAPRFELDSRAFRTVPRTGEVGEVAAAIEQSLVEEQTPTVTHRSGMTGRTSIDVVLGQWLTGLVLLGAGLAVYLGRVLWRPFHRGVRRTMEQAAAMLALLGGGWLLVFVVLPWAVQEVPDLLNRLLTIGGGGGASQDGATGLDAVLAALGITGLLATAVKSFTSLAIKEGKAHIDTVSRLVVGIVVPLLAVLVFLDLLEFATANGPSGRMLGFGLGLGLADLPLWLSTDVARWLWVLAALVGLGTVDAHSWSLFPFYKRRLSEAYAIRRVSPTQATDVRYEDGPVLIRDIEAEAEHAPQDAALRTTSHAQLVAPRAPQVDGESVAASQLVMCCAANVADRSVAPPGRRSVSFTVSAEVVGSPELGWMDTREYFARLDDRRLSDVTLPSLMAISGAAVSPGMGKMSRGPIDSLLALLNVRLGVWLPHPAEVERLAAGERWRGRPWWWWYLREVAGAFPKDGPYLYVSDGGHWENLGVVELFRRGCTEIWCISAAGDGPESFSTIGEALALVREEMAIDVKVDLSPMRRPAEAPKVVRRPLRRRPKVATADPVPDAVWATKPCVTGTFTYPDGTPGRIVILEANLTDEIPWDVQTWAESTPVFPDHRPAVQPPPVRELPGARPVPDGGRPRRDGRGRAPRRRGGGCHDPRSVGSAP
ncbi:hypothetical protein [Actinomarinicola tropica]|uniref:PNPLA domain-containing protein n=1 Tax=Actinomarinicola tropica TaxID=2789776 RepID=A0A5Q2RG01_9ACTN|nr:hypothetical protein [Actinomarinicola tropica]QGG94574.1 hypothetical protein GH723_05325 [Actinomarinicola tropica]